MARKNLAPLARPVALSIALCLALGVAGSAQAGPFSVKPNLRQTVQKAAKKTVKKVQNADGPLKKLVQEVDPEKLIQMLQMTRSAIEFVIAEKKKLDAWSNHGGAARTRANLKSIIDDVAGVETNLHELACAVAPERSMLSTSKQQKRVGTMKTIIGAAPKPLLWAADTAFSMALGDDWGNIVGDVNDEIDPVASKVGQLCAFRDELQNPAYLELARCGILRDPAFDRLEKIQNRVGIARGLVRFANSFVKDDIVVQAGATVAAGGGAGTNVKNPTKTLLDNVESKLAKVDAVLGKLSEQRSSCESRDERIERDLMTCNALVRYDTDDYPFVQDLARRRYDEMYANGLNQTHIPWSHIEGGSFVEVCTSYQDLRFGPE